MLKQETASAEENPRVLHESGKDDAAKRSILRQHTFGRLWTSTIASSIASGASVVIINWIVFAATGSAFDIALVGVATLVPRIVFGITSGAIADRYGRLRVMIASNALRAAIMLILAAYLFFFGFQFYLVLASVFVIGLGQSLFLPAISAFLPTAVSAEELGSANGLLQTAQQVTSIAGSPLGGVLIGVIGVAATVVFNSATYMLAGLLIAAISLPLSLAGTKAKPRSKDSSFFSEVREGFAYLSGERGLLELTLFSFVATPFLYMFITFLVVYDSDVLRQGAGVYGALLAIIGVGVVVGSLLVGRFHPDRRFGLWFPLSWGFAGISILGLVLFPAVIPAMAFLFVVGLLAGFASTTFFTGTQKFIPNDLQGRYYGLDDAGTYAATPAGQIIGGIVIGAAGVGADFTIAAVGIALSCFIFLLFPDLRRLRAH